jgi:hypothetical protein
MFSSFGQTVKRSYSICRRTFADKETSLSFLPSQMPTAFNLEEITGVDKGIKEEDFEFIPVKPRFRAALRRIAFFIVSSSVAEDPSSATTCLLLRLTIGAQGIVCGSVGGEGGLVDGAGSVGEEARTGDVGGV